MLNQITEASHNTKSKTLHLGHGGFPNNKSRTLHLCHRGHNTKYLLVDGEKTFCFLKVNDGAGNLSAYSAHAGLLSYLILSYLILSAIQILYEDRDNTIYGKGVHLMILWCITNNTNNTNNTNEN